MDSLPAFIGNYPDYCKKQMLGHSSINITEINIHPCGDRKAVGLPD